MTLDGIQQRWPAADLQYLRLLATTLLAVLIAPLVLAHLLLHPFDVAEHAIEGHVR
jgi:hypothetical protein